jgi:hypothetical protein
MCVRIGIYMELTVYFACDAVCWGEDWVIAKLSHPKSWGGVTETIDSFVSIEAFSICLLDVGSISGFVGVHSVACILGDAGNAAACVLRDWYCGVETSDWGCDCR